MDVPPIGATQANTSAASGQLDSAQSDNLHNAFTAARKLNSLNITGREYAVIRDPASKRFVLVVRDRETGTVLDQFPPEDILKMLTQLESADARETGEQYK
jgi:uncharacterized FlaG/YvyC family protein